jgi:hypothetical protein
MAENTADKPSLAAARKDANYVLENPLDQYSSYTYGLSLFVLSKQEYNQLAQNSKVWTPTRCLVASAGRGLSSGMPRAAGWEDNFYFENLKMTSVIGANSQGRGSNVIEVSFSLIEPYGLSLLDRMIQTSKDMGVKSYIGLCYMLQIDFHVADADPRFAGGGPKTLQEHRKYIPINIVDLTVKVSAKGSEYEISAVPFSHHALSHTLAATPANFEVNGGTLREFFRADDSSSSKVASGGAEQVVREKTSEAATGVGQDGTRASTTGTTSTSDQKKYVVNSYCAAYNAWQKKLVELKVLKEYNTIEVLFHDDILKGEKITRTGQGADGTLGASSMALPGNKHGANELPDEKVDRWTFPAGTMITEVINTAMLNSDYIRNQVIVGEENAASAPAKKLNWWKVVPTVELKDYDDVTQKWYFKVKYIVIPYVVHNATHINAPKYSVAKADCIKEYSYIYTGQNISVIDFQAQFDYLYFTKVASLRPDKVESSEKRKELKEVTEVSSIQATKNAIIQAVTHPVTGEVTVQGTGSGKDVKAIAATSIMENIYTKGQAEMLSITIKIIGDPTWIKQDDLYISGSKFFTPGKRSSTSDGVATDPDYNNRSINVENNNNSLVMDAGEVLCWLQFRNPVDMDELTGGLRTGLNAESSFTGVYKCLTVDSEFSGGKFTQTLDLIRLADQVQDRVFADLKNGNPADQLIKTAVIGTDTGQREADIVAPTVQGIQYGNDRTSTIVTAYPVKNPDLVVTTVTPSN